MLRIEKLSALTWNDFVSLMQSDRQCAECWCLNHRRPAGCPTGEAAQAEMKKLVGIGQVGGLLAYGGDQCVGWIAIDPMKEMVGHDCTGTARSGEWGIHCIFIRNGFRGRGISKELIRSAIALARERGAALISAFPIPEQKRSRYPVNEAEFSGRFTTYAKLGFQIAGDPSDFYQRVELDGDINEG